MLKTQKCVHDMMVDLDLELPNEEAPGVHNLNYELYYNLIEEEVVKELLPAIRALQKHHFYDQWAEVIDGICDTIVVLHNLTNAMGLDIEPFFDEVHRTNMAKAGGPMREDGKRLKPPGWKPPQIKRMLMEKVNESRKSVREG